MTQLVTRLVKRSGLQLAVAMLWIVGIGISLTAFGQKAQPETSAQFFPVEQVKPGMKAIGYTVFTGGEPKKFELEILGVLTSFPNPGQNAV